MLSFTLESFANEFLPEGGRHLDVVVTVTASGTSAARAAGDAYPAVAQVIVVDASGSMDGNKIQQARAAAAVAVESLRPGTRFALVAGTETARMVYPDRWELAAAGRTSRADATRALRRLRAGGGTAISTWVIAAAHLLRDEPGVRHAILLTDGKNEYEQPEDLERAVDAARGSLQCDCRGVGTDWSVAELRMVADRLMGTVDIVADPSGLTADFAAISERIMGLEHSQVELRVWTPQGVTTEVFTQVAPEVLAMPGHVSTDQAATRDYPTGAWGTESRSYQLRLGLVPGAVGEEILAARISLVDRGQVIAKALVRGTWTDDLELSTRVHPHVGHYTGQTRMSTAIRDGLVAQRNGDLARAQGSFGEAVALAAAGGNEEALSLLARVVDVEDAPTGRVRVRTHVDQVDEMTLDARSTRTTSVRRRAVPPS